MPIKKTQTDIDEIAQNASLYEETNFDARADALDLIEFGIVNEIETWLQKDAKANELILLKNRAEKLKVVLEKVDINLFEKLRRNIRSGKCKGAGFKDMVNEYADINLDQQEGEPDYDNLDIFINGLLPIHEIPQQTKHLEPEMVFYQKTPARIVFEMVERCNFTKEDVFVDLGSGLGQVAILVNLLAQITVKGIEFEPAFCEHASASAAELNLPNITFVNADARNADYSTGTVFFMFTPFNGGIMRDVLELLRKEALKRKIKIITYGPCTAQVALEKWLNCKVDSSDNIYQMAVFSNY